MAPRTRWTLLVGAAAALVVCLTLLVLQSDHVLLRHGAWIVVKRKMQLGVMGADEMLVSRQPLAGNRLHLGAWFGRHALETSRTFTEVRRLEADVRLDDDGRLFVGVADAGGETRGVELRAGRSARIVRAGDDGEVRAQRELALEARPRTWHHLVLDFSTSGGLVRLDGGTPLALDFSARGVAPFRVALRSGATPVVVDDVRVESDGAAWRDTFAPDRGWSRLLLMHALAVGLFALIVGVGPRAFGRRGGRDGLSRVITALLIATFFVGATLLFDRLYWSHLELCARTHDLFGRVDGRPIARIESVRQRLFDWWRGVVLREAPVRSADVAAAGYPSDRVWEGPVVCDRSRCRAEPATALSGRTARMAILGTSQTIGSGAPILDESAFAQVCARVAPAGDALACVNLAISGSRCHLLVDKWRSLLSTLRPEVLVAVFGVNDRPDELAACLPSLVRSSRSLGTRVVLVREAAASEVKLAVIDRVATEEHTPVVDLRACIDEREREERGFVWWDDVHFTAYGHRLAAGCLSGPLLDELRRPAGQSDAAKPK